MMLFLLCILFVLVSSTNNIVMWGSGADLKLVIDGINCDYADNSCYDVINTLHQQGGNNLKYISFAPLDTKNKMMDCNVIKKNENTNAPDIFVFGVYDNLDTTFQFICDSYEECFRIGCKLFNEYDIVWISFGNDYYSAKQKEDVWNSYDPYDGYGYPM